MPEATLPSTALTLKDLRVCPDGEARVTDIRLGQALGFQRVRKVRDLIRAYSAELLTYGELAQVGAKSGITPQVGAKICRGRPVAPYLLNEAQALLVAMFARTAQAAKARKNIIQVYMAHRNGGVARADQRPRSLGNTPETRAVYAGQQLANRLASQKKHWSDITWKLHREHGFDVLKADIAAVLAYGIRRNENQGI